MTVRSTARKVLNTEYRMVRAPIDVVQDRVLSRAPEGVRSRIERTVAELDCRIGSLLDDEEIRRRGEDVLHKQSVDATADRRKQAAENRREAKHARVAKQADRSIDEAQAKRAQASAQRASASQRRADAERFEDLADAQKAARKL